MSRLFEDSEAELLDTPSKGAMQTLVSKALNSEKVSLQASSSTSEDTEEVGALLDACSNATDIDDRSTCYEPVSAGSNESTSASEIVDMRGQLSACLLYTSPSPRD